MRSGWVVIFVLMICIAFSCADIVDSEAQDTKVWKLGWRMIDSFWGENYELAEAQFDTLVAQSSEMDAKFLIVGLEVKHQLGQSEDIVRILKSQKREALYEVCQSEDLRSYEPCSAVEILKPTNEELQRTLIKMFINDQYVRSNLMEDMMEKYQLKKNDVVIDSFGFSTDDTNREMLQEIISEFGFPTKAMVGKDAMSGVFSIIQHANDDWQESQLPNIEAAVKAKDMDARSYAYLRDRIRTNSGKEQLYGTQFEMVDRKENTYRLFPVEDLDNLDQRRQKLGLMPISMYEKLHARSVKGIR